MVSCLLIDKNAGERDRVSALLAGLGFDCEGMNAPADGLRYFQDNHPDVVVMEASQLPEAREFLRHATYQGQRTGRPVVIVYADQPNFETMGEMILDGAAEFLMKPFSKDLLQFKLKQAGVLAH